MRYAQRSNPFTKRRFLDLHFNIAIRHSIKGLLIPQEIQSSFDRTIKFLFYCLYIA